LQVQGFSGIPKALDDEEIMIIALDAQLTEIARAFRTSAEAALSL
jgi:hypothetical protein